VSSPEFSIVIPVYNEEKLAPSAAAELCRALDGLGWNYELLLCENGSKDSTAKLVDDLAKESPRIRALHENEPNYGRALKHGILESRGKYVICDEIDLCDVDFYQRAIPLLKSGEAELVVGSKVLAGAKDERPFIRHAGTLVINGLLRVALNFRGTDTHGLKAFRRDALLDVAKECVVEKDLFASEFVIRAGRRHKKVVEIPIVVVEKRRPSINLTKRVPKVLKDLSRLVWVIRVQNR
jgi:glycosyltransferase involved in cell wall biosynthesis